LRILEKIKSERLAPRHKPGTGRSSKEGVDNEYREEQRRTIDEQQSNFLKLQSSTIANPTNLVKQFSRLSGRCVRSFAQFERRGATTVL
jgi:hypothetical protein